ncbi:uncharacterized protein C7orf57 homolog [Aplochiton taeniatus]
MASLKTGNHEAAACTGPSSQIPGLSQNANDGPEERSRGRRVGVADSDSVYVKLAKQGGQKDLLWHEETNLETKPNSSYKPPDWFSSTSDSEVEKLSPTEREMPSFMLREEFKKSTSGFQPRDAPFGSDNKSTWERDNGKEKKLEVAPNSQMEKLSVTTVKDYESNKYKKISYEKKTVPYSMSKLLSFGYAEDDKGTTNCNSAKE